MKVFETVKALREWRASAGNARVGLVPTMGCLHRGHLELVRQAKARTAKSVVSVFVNPLQFAPHEDFDRYPRTFGTDCELLAQAGVDAVFHPSVSEFYPAGFQTTVKVDHLTRHLDGAARPHFFGGVATVCLKLFLASGADLAVFGEKDFQQLRTIQRLVRDLHVPIEILGVPTVREADGLALSSRNGYLSADERRAAVRVPRSLAAAVRAAAAPGALVDDARRAALGVFEGSPFKLDYVEIVGASLEPLPAAQSIAEIDEPRVLVAARIGTTRLIDNCDLRGAPPSEAPYGEA